MLVKMIQNLKNRMEKMQESTNTFNKDLEEIKNNDNKKVNSKIAEIKNTLLGINSIISKTEEWISELEERMVEITAKEQNKGKRIKGTEWIVSDTSAAVLSPPTFNL